MILDLCVIVCLLVMCSYVFICFSFIVFFFKQKTAYEMRISDWSSDVCSSDLLGRVFARERAAAVRARAAVGIDNDLAAGKTAIALRAANHEHPGRVDHELGLGCKIGRAHV